MARSSGLGRVEPSAQAKAIHDQDGSGASIMTSPPRIRARCGATHGQDSSGVSLTTSPPRAKTKCGATHGHIIPFAYYMRA